MNLKVRLLESGSEWSSELEAFEDKSIFHTNEWLESAREITGLELIRMEVLDRNGPVMLLPLFAKKMGVIVSLLSPPPGLAFEFLGPLYRFPAQAKRDRKESIAIEATRMAIEACETQRRPSLFFVRCGPFVQDVRPFQWLGFHPTPLYTYEIDLRQGLDAVLRSFKLELRNGLKRMRDGIEIREAGEDAADVIHDLVDARFKRQDLAFAASPKYLRSLLSRLRPSKMTAFLAVRDGRHVGGIIVTNYSGRAAAWIGARSPDAGAMPVTDLLVWKAIEWGSQMGASRFEIMGANVQRLRAFKAKYNAELVTFFQLEKSRLAGKLISNAYRHLRRVGIQGS